jgi:hypothetical protein
MPEPLRGETSRRNPTDRSKCWCRFIGHPKQKAVAWNLDGLPGAEIVVSSQKGVSVFHNDGSLYWFNDAVKTDMAAALPSAIWMMSHALNEKYNCHFFK